jgi:hypothetical protein
MKSVDDGAAIHQLVARFANSFDLKDWEALGLCLSATIYADYSDLRGTPPETISREHFVELRRIALEGLNTHHLSGNVQIELGDAQALAKVSMVIFRRNRDENIFNTHCLYTFGVERVNGEWCISSIVQKVFWSDGQKDIHRGISR